MFLLSLIFIACGLGGGYYLYTKSPLASIPSVIPQTKKIPSIITPDSQKILAIGNLKNELLAQKIQSQIANSKTDEQKITEFILTNTQGSSTNRINAIEIIDSLGYSSPDMFNRSLVETWMLGVYGEENTETRFIILKTNFFQNAFAGILRWEAAMPEELATLLNYRGKIKEQNAMSPSTAHIDLTAPLHPRQPRGGHNGKKGNREGVVLSSEDRLGAHPRLIASQLQPHLLGSGGNVIERVICFLPRIGPTGTAGG
jgi:hypothetical protein